MPDQDQTKYSYCSVPQMPERALDPSVPPGRARLIRMLDDKWANGTTLHYYFFDREADGERVFSSNGTSEWRPWTTSNAEKDVVRQAFRDLEGRRDRPRVRGGERARGRGDSHRLHARRRRLVLSRPRRARHRRQPAHHELRLGPHPPGAGSRHGRARDRPHAGLPARASEPQRRHRLGRGGGLRRARQAAQQLGPRHHLPQHHPQDPAGQRAGLELGSALDHALPVRGRA